MLFMLAAAWTLQAGGHVRVDVFYAGASARTKACICSAKPGMTNRDIPE
jgi:TRAP-type mannitol/chloroaromatic compound transport system permease small subunit